VRIYLNHNKGYGILIRVDEIFGTRLGTVVHICNPSFLGGRDWEEYGSKTA
jgi:hypothetical protein